MNEEKPFVAKVWEEFSTIDLEGYTKTLKHAGNAVYLPWANAWTLIMQRYPESHFDVSKGGAVENKSAEVWCSLTIVKGGESVTRQMWLPVMDAKNNAIFDPSTRAISDTRMRCLVKCAALFGLGTHLYTGDDLPKIDAAPNLEHGAITEEQAANMTALMEEVNADINKFLTHFNIKEISELPKAKFKGAIAMLEAKRK